jgi:hypothetical protein
MTRTTAGSKATILTPMIKPTRSTPKHAVEGVASLHHCGLHTLTMGAPLPGGAWESGRAEPHRGRPDRALLHQPRYSWALGALGSLLQQVVVAIEEAIGSGQRQRQRQWQWQWQRARRPPDAGAPSTPDPTRPPGPRNPQPSWRASWACP